MDQVVVVWDCRVRCPKPIDVWRVVTETAGGVRPTTVLVLQPPDTEIPAPVQAIMRMTASKLFVGADAVEFCFLDVCLTIATAQNPRFVLVTDDLPTFSRAFRLEQASQAVFITGQKPGWPLAEAAWTKQLQSVAPPRRSKAR